MAKAIRAWRDGIHSLIELAVRGDGVLFRRVQDRSARYGYVLQLKQISTQYGQDQKLIGLDFKMAREYKFPIMRIMFFNSQVRTIE